jgi:hypothetical protein
MHEGQERLRAARARTRERSFSDLPHEEDTHGADEEWMPKILPGLGFRV